MKPLLLHVIESTETRGLLSLRMENTEGGLPELTFRAALTASGAKVGMVLVLKEAVPEGANHCQCCGQQLPRAGTL